MYTTEINRLNDFYFKYLLGNEKRKNLTIHFLNAVLYGDETPHITDVVFIDKDKEPQQTDSKLVKLDILARTDAGMLIDIEVQIQRHPHLAERFLYYWAEMYGGQLKRDDEYSALKPAVSIVLMDFEYLPEESWHNVYHICNDVSKQVLTHHFAMHFIELKKFRYSDIKSLHRLGKWTAYFSNCSAEETEELAMSDPIMKEVVNAEMAFTEDEIMRRQYTQREKALRDYRSDMAEARREGRQEGILEGKREGILEGKREGRQEEKVSIAVNMLRLGIDASHIAAATGLSMADVELLKTKLP